MKQINATILENRRLAGRYYKTRIESPYLARNIKPGQFMEVRCSDGTEPFLRRPFSVHRILKNGIEILYEVIGKGTEALARRRPGEALDVIGPLGNGFELRKPQTANRKPLLIAGGMGVAPLVAVAEEIVHSPQSTVHSKKKKIHVLIGAKTKDGISCENDFKKLGAEVLVATEDGSQGKRGFITDCLTSLVSTVDCGLSTIYACGPNAMLEEVARIAKAKRIPCQVSLEEYMACGVGVCLGCPVKIRSNDERRTTNDEYKMVCKDGPVFDAEEIMW